MQYKYRKQLFEMEKGSSKRLYRAYLCAEDYMQILETESICEFINFDGYLVEHNIFNDIEGPAKFMVEAYVERKKLRY